MTVVFVAPDDSDDEELSNCEENNHLKYKFLIDEVESVPKQKDLTISNGNKGKAEAASIDSK
jgi:hypothetical protein